MLDFSRLGHKFFTEVDSYPLSNARLIHKNQALYQQLKLDMDDKSLLKITAGEQQFQNTKPLSSIYAGHQFGHFVPQLGDGRSCLIGQTEGFEISLKGAGQTPYSRGADGRAVLRSSIREYLCSMAMHGLGIATTQALALVGSDTEVYRENIETAAIITRVAQSHIRFGHFELFASRGQTAQVKQLADFVIEHYYPECQGNHRYTDLLAAVVKRTAIMIAHWQAQGFAHGVMNSDNMSILGLTIDFGPFSFVEQYNPHFICNHSDYEGRYAFDQQPSVALWNLSCLADSLLSLIDTKQAKSALAEYQKYLVEAYSALMRQKFGLIEKDNKDNELIGQFLQLLHQHNKDYSNTLRQLSDLEKLAKDHNFNDWIIQYQQRLDQEKNQHKTAMMNAVNPKYILRNYLAEIAIQQAQNQQNYTEIDTLFTLLSQPFTEHNGFDKYTEQAPDWAKNLSVSCSS